jgi:hypothetical protein
VAACHLACFRNPGARTSTLLNWALCALETPRVNWDAIGAIGEILGAIAVFASLIYLAIQIRAQIKQQRKQTIDGLTENWLNALETQTRPEVADVWTRGMSDFEALTLSEKAQFSSLTGRIFRIAEGFYHSHETGDISDELWEGQSAMVSDIMMHSGVVSAWENRKHWYSKSFRNYVESTIMSKKGRTLFPRELN